MADLAIRLFGRFDASGGLRFGSARCRELLALLLVKRSRECGNDYLIECLWPDERQPENARHALNTELWRLRRAIDASAFSHAARIERSSAGLKLVLAPEVSIDLHRFADLIAELRAADASGVSSDAARHIDELYDGDLLPEFYSDWALLAREAARNDYVFAMEHRLAEMMQVGKWQEAIHFARGVLRVEPLLEHVHRHIMLCHLRMSDRAAAILQYRELERRLARELDCTPMPETVALFESLETGGEAPAFFAAADASLRFTSIARQLEQAVTALAAAADALKRLDRA